MNNPRLKPFFTYFGGKYRIAPRYPKPQYNTIIEPFAGSAGYSLRYPEREVILNDLDPVISGIWEYLIKVKEEEVLALPLLVYGESLDDIKLIPEAKNFIGQCLQTGRPSPRKKLSSAVYTRPGTVWCESMRSRIASQLCQIRHWKITSKSYLDLDNREATWFIDPPYEKAGKAYIVNQMDYAACATFCKSREGQTLVCEAEGASWLPFEPFTDNPSNASRVTKEVIWTNEN